MSPEGVQNTAHGSREAHKPLADRLHRSQALLDRAHKLYRDSQRRQDALRHRLAADPAPPTP
jgi:hypothetical protein